MSSSELRAALARAVGALPAGLREHVWRVVEEARRLAPGSGVDEERAVVAALGHDLARARTPEALLREAEAAGLLISEVERAQPALLHGPLSAHLLATRFGVQDREVLAAARHHTTARAGMSALERLIYVADKIEPEKAASDAALAEARALAWGNGIHAALRHLLDAQVAKALERGWPLHPDTVAARNELVIAEGG